MDDIIIKNIVDFANQCMNNVIKNKNTFITNVCNIIDNKKIVIDIHPEVQTKYFNLIVNAIKKEFKEHVDNVYLSYDSKYEFFINITLKEIKKTRLEKINKIIDDGNI